MGGNGAEKDRVSIRRGTCRRTRAKGAIGAADIFNDEILAEYARQAFTIKPRQAIGAAAGRESRNDADRAVGPIGFLRARDVR